LATLSRSPASERIVFKGAVLTYSQDPLDTFPRSFPVDREVANLLDLLRRTWCNGFWPLQGAACRRSAVPFGRSPAPLTSRFDKDFGPVPPIVCLFLLSDFLLLDVVPFLSLVHVCGTIYLQASHITSSPSLLTFKQGLKCTYFVFTLSYPSLAFLCGV